LTASSTRSNTGAPGARFLDVSIGRIKSDTSGRNAEMNRELLALVRSSGFFDMATAGYTTQYYNDRPTIAELAPTLTGDQPITSSAKLDVLVDIGSPNPQGWLHVASWRTSLHVTDLRATDLAASAHEAVKRATAPLYVFAEPQGTAGPTDAPASIDDWFAYKAGTTLVLTRARLLRGNAPILNYVGTMHAGSLGAVLGAAPPFACVTLVEPPRPFLVFVERKLVERSDAHASGYDGIIHLWAHGDVTAPCPTPSAAPA
jgi:hypothetical protein